MDTTTSVRRPHRALESSATQSTVRESNLALVARTLFDSPEPLSRADIAAATTLTRATVSRLVDDLLLGGIVVEREKTAGTPGRPATPVVPHNRLCALGMQVNAGFTIVRLIGLDGALIAESATTGDLVGSDPATVLRELGRTARRLLEGHLQTRRLVGAGLALPGLVRSGSGLLLRAPNLGWTELAPAELMAAPDLTAGLLVGNEADLAAVSIAYPTPGRQGPQRDFIYLSGEIGIGGAAVLDGRVMAGRHGWAGEIGHVCVDPDGPPCPCGSRGCLERFAGSRVLMRAAGLEPDAPVSELIEAIEDGSTAARAAVDAAAAALETALVSTINLLDIPEVVLGGHLGRLGRYLLPRVQAAVRGRAIAGRFDGPVVSVDQHVTTDDAAPAATGAAVAVLNQVIDNPAAWLG
ncbi:MAG: ROK family protein [Micrococcales bacterium]|nr:ROK family protein [Micrococcales bacterium]